MVEEAVLEASEEWLWRYLYNSQKLYTPKHKITKLISNIKLSREKANKTVKTKDTKNEKVGIFQRIRRKIDTQIPN